MNSENKTLLRGRIVFRFYFESDLPYHDMPIMQYSRNFNTNNAKKVFKEARSYMRSCVNMFNRDIGAEICLDMYELAESNPETHTYKVVKLAYTKYFGQLCCFVTPQFRSWYWSYNTDGELHITRWTERSK